MFTCFRSTFNLLLEFLNLSTLLMGGTERTLMLQIPLKLSYIETKTLINLVINCLKANYLLTYSSH